MLRIQLDQGMCRVPWQWEHGQCRIQQGQGSAWSCGGGCTGDMGSSGGGMRCSGRSAGSTVNAVDTGSNRGEDVQGLVGAEVAGLWGPAILNGAKATNFWCPLVACWLRERGCIG